MFISKLYDSPTYKRILNSIARRLTSAGLRLQARLHTLHQVYLERFACRLPLRGVDLKYPSYYGAIGHLVLDIDCILKDRILEQWPSSWKMVLFAPRSQIVSKHLVKTHWAQYFDWVIYSDFLYKIFRYIIYPVEIDKYCRIELSAARAFEVQARWGQRAPLLQLSPSDEAYGERVLQKWGLPKNAWFVCFHAREATYRHSPEHNVRNVKIETYFESMNYIAALGGWSIRLGDPNMTPLPRDLPNTIDYALLPERSERLDIFLNARCRFLIGSNSGLNALAICLGSYVGLTNMCPYFALPLNHRGVGIFKKLYSQDEGRVLSISEVFANRRFGQMVFQRDFDSNGIQVIDNTSEEILVLTKEMLDRSSGSFKDDDDNWGLQNQFRKLIQPDYYCYRASSWIGKKYLKENLG